MKNINEMTSKELKEMAKELKVKNWWTLKKAELIAEITAVQNAQNEPEEVEEVADDEVIAENEEAAQNEPETSEEKPNKKQDLIEYNGKTQNLSQWAKELGMPGQTLFARIHLSGWTVEKAFTTPVKKRNKKTEEEA